MIATESPRIEALKTLFGAYRADTSKYSAKAYRDELADIPDDVLVKAVSAAIQGEAFMPTVARLRTYCDRVKPEVPAVAALPAGEVKPGYYLSGDVAPLDDNDPRLWVHCALCRDTGWVESVEAKRPPYTMPVATSTGVEARVIEVERKSYFAHCHCRPTNPKMVAQRQRTVKYSRENTE